MIINSLDDKVKEALQICSVSAFSQDIKLYLVGGVVRDLLLKRRITDVDICMEYDAIEFAKLLENGNFVEIMQIQPNLRTSKVKFKNGVILDFASTRCENYPRYSHLPSVTDFYCSLEKDVSRRDFTVNSIAISLSKENYGEIIDFTGGLYDIEQKKIKILHDKSFFDDPSRIVRALKYSIRFGFKLDDSTKQFMNEYLLNLPDEICYSRIMSEIKQVFNENGVLAFEKFYEWNIEKLFGARKNSNYKKLQEAFSKFKINDTYFNLFAFVLINIENNVFENVFSQLPLDVLQRKIITETRELINLQEEKNKIEIYYKFNEKDTTSIALYYAAVQKNDAIVYNDKLKDIKLEINGDDLIAFGLRPSAKFKIILKKTLEEKIEGKLLTKDDEINFVKSLI